MARGGLMFAPEMQKMVSKKNIKTLETSTHTQDGYRSKTEFLDLLGGLDAQIRRMAKEGKLTKKDAVILVNDSGGPTNWRVMQKIADSCRAVGIKKVIPLIGVAIVGRLPTLRLLNQQQEKYGAIRTQSFLNMRRLSELIEYEEQRREAQREVHNAVKPAHLLVLQHPNKAVHSKLLGKLQKRKTTEGRLLW